MSEQEREHYQFNMNGVHKRQPPYKNWEQEKADYIHHFRQQHLRIEQLEKQRNEANARAARSAIGNHSAKRAAKLQRRLDEAQNTIAHLQRRLMEVQELNKPMMREAV